jgi:Ca2+-binding EF-hand superfamily protein
MTNQHRLIAILFMTFAGCATDESQPSAPRERAADEHMAKGEQLFTDLDQDHSGTLSAAEVANLEGPAKMLEVHFTEIDADDDGLVTRDELRAAMQQHHADMEEHHADALQRFDADGDGELSATERQAAHRYYFDQADADHSGALSAAELRAAPGPGAMLLAHMSEIDRNGDGALGYEEITTAMESHHRSHP